MTEPTAPEGSSVSQRVMEVRTIAETLWFIPPPGRMMIADKLHGLGLRGHPELATLQLEREGPVELGAHAPTRVVQKASMTDGMAALAQVNPVLAARIQAARDDPEMQARIKQAETDAQKIALAKEMGYQTPDDLPENLKDQITKLVPPQSGDA